TVDSWCEAAIEAIRASLAGVVEAARASGPRRVEVERTSEPLGPWGACGEGRAEVVAAFNRVMEQLEWSAVSLSLDGSEPTMLGESSLLQAGAKDRLRLIPIVVTTSHGNELLLVADSLLSVEASTRLLGSPPSHQWRERWVPTIDEAEAILHVVPRFDYLGTTWEPVIPDPDRWIAVRELHQHNDPEQAELLAALQHGEGFNEWLARSGDEARKPRSINPADSSRLEPADDGGLITGLRLFFVPTDHAQTDGRTLRTDDAFACQFSATAISRNSSS
ncbi:MAG: hypothetical protein ACO31E_13720, partial [Phycisphaerales bacterium]